MTLTDEERSSLETSIRDRLRHEGVTALVLDLALRVADLEAATPTHDEPAPEELPAPPPPLNAMRLMPPPRV